MPSRSDVTVVTAPHEGTTGVIELPYALYQVPILQLVQISFTFLLFYPLSYRERCVYITIAFKTLSASHMQDQGTLFETEAKTPQFESEAEAVKIAP